MLRHIAAIAFIFVCATVAWVILGATVEIRTAESKNTSRLAVEDLWGGTQVQRAPWMQVIVDPDHPPEGQQADEAAAPRRPVTLPLASSDLDVALRLDHRRKGLLWHSTYGVDFHGRYTVHNAGDEAIVARIRYAFPEGAQVLDDFRFLVDGEPVADAIREGELVQDVVIAPATDLEFEIAYRSQGMGTWRYTFGERVQEVANFRLALTTDFHDVDFPRGTLSPTHMEPFDGGRQLSWHYTRLLADAAIGVEMPQRLNPGPWVSRVTFFAPVSLFLFFFLLFILTVVREVRLHPMHYFFLAAAFFAFHLLLAYLVDHVSVHLATAVASVVSLGLVISYMRLVVSDRFAFFWVGLAQLVYLVGFSYTFFLEGYTGLAITVMTIVTLFAVMQTTARLDWETVFRAAPGRVAGAGG
jgi:hypothetical protein